MTDRSSEERSRFEKWWEKEMQAEPSADSVSKSYARDAWMVRAALEDRQEAAPGSNGWVICPNCKTGFGVPSEATPIKEICPRCRGAFGGCLVCNKTENLSNLPAPEVQGTPTKEILAAKKGSKDCTPCPKCGDLYVRMFCRNCGEDLDTPYVEWTAEEIAAEMVGTPQPPSECTCGVGWDNAPECKIHKAAPMPSMPYGADAQNFGAVPEGVQGKEPHPEGAYVNQLAPCGFTLSESFDLGYKDGFSAGEAAGRRSAITEIREWVTKRYGHAYFIPKAAAIAKCAELLEKTKP